MIKLPILLYQLAVTTNRFLSTININKPIIFCHENLIIKITWNYLLLQRKHTYITANIQSTVKLPILLIYQFADLTRNTFLSTIVIDTQIIFCHENLKYENIWSYLLIQRKNSGGTHLLYNTTSHPIYDKNFLFHFINSLLQQTDFCPLLLTQR